MKRTVIGILAHVDAGKTTLAEAMLYCSGTLRKLGRVDHGNAFLDTFELERKRGITIFSKQAILSTEFLHATLLDTPGHADFSAGNGTNFKYTGLRNSGYRRYFQYSEPHPNNLETAM